MGPTTNATHTAAGGAGGAGGAPAINVCACMGTFLLESDPADPCYGCHYDSVLDGAPCDALQNECTADDECNAIRNCLTPCVVDAVVDADCVADCMLPIDKSPGATKYNAWVSCMCGECVAECDSHGDLACDLDGGGAGGSP